MFSKDKQKLKSSYNFLQFFISNMQMIITLYNPFYDQPVHSMNSVCRSIYQQEMFPGSIIFVSWFSYLLPSFNGGRWVKKRTLSFDAQIRTKQLNIKTKTMRYHHRLVTDMERWHLKKLYFRFWMLSIHCGHLLCR